MEATPDALESFDDMTIEEIQKDTFTKITPQEEHEVDMDFDKCPFKKIDQADFKVKRQLTSSTSFRLQITDFVLKNTEYKQPITNVQVLRYSNRIVFYVTDANDRPGVSIQAQGITHDANNFGEEQEGAEYNVSVLMGDRTQTTLFEVFTRNIIETLNTPEEGYQGEKQPIDEDDFENFGQFVAGDQESSLKYNDIIVFVGIKLSKSGSSSSGTTETSSKKHNTNKHDLQYLKYVSWVISKSFRDIFK